MSQDKKERKIAIDELSEDDDNDKVIIDGDESV
jgi:hypothetical protein